MMITKLIVQIIFYGLMAILGTVSAVMVYVLLKYGKSKVLALVLSGFFIVIMISLYGAAVGNFQNLTFPEFLSW